MLAPLACGTAVVADIKNRKKGSGVSVSEKYDYEKILKYKASIVITTQSAAFKLRLNQRIAPAYIKAGDILCIFINSFPLVLTQFCTHTFQENCSIFQLASPAL